MGDIGNATKFQIRVMVADVLGWRNLRYEDETLYGLSPLGVSFPIPTPRWERDLLDALGLMAHFKSRYLHKSEGFQAHTYLSLDVCTDLSGSVEWKVDGPRIFERYGGRYGEEHYHDLRSDGPFAICKAFLQAMAQLDEVLKDEYQDG